MIRRHIENDLERIMKIWEESSTLAHPFLDTTFVEKVKMDMRHIYIPGSETCVFEIDELVVGFISMFDDEIAGLFVLPEYHSKGIGTKLVNYVNEFHKKLEVEVFEENKIGRSFYDTYGFKLDKEYVHLPSGERVLRLIK